MCRNWAIKYKYIYVVCGPILGKNYDTLKGSKIAIPKAFYKVVLCMTGKPKAIGFIYKNEDPKPRTKISDYAVSVDELERITSIDFFPKLPDNIENDIESKCDYKLW